MAIITELGSPTNPNSANQARVKFTVRQSGRYSITVMVGNQHVAGSPFTRAFVAGPVDPQHTVVLRHCSTVVCTASVGHLLYVEPRDEYGNLCSYGPSEDPTQVGIFIFSDSSRMPLLDFCFWHLHVFYFVKRSNTHL